MLDIIKTILDKNGTSKKESTTKLNDHQLLL